MRDAGETTVVVAVVAAVAFFSLVAILTVIGNYLKRPVEVLRAQCLGSAMSKCLEIHKPHECQEALKNFTCK